MLTVGSRYLAEPSRPFQDFALETALESESTPVSRVLAVRTEGRAIIRRRSSKSFCCHLILSCPQPGRIRTRPPLNQEEQ
jgi:hypothetical protein